MPLPRGAAAGRDGSGFVENGDSMMRAHHQDRTALHCLELNPQVVVCTVVRMYVFFVFTLLSAG